MTNPESLLALWRQRDLDGLLAQVARSRRIGALQILSDARARIYSDARHELYLALRELGLSYPSIGALFGRDQSSISVAIRYRADTAWRERRKAVRARAK